MLRERVICDEGMADAEISLLVSPETSTVMFIWWVSDLFVDFKLMNLFYWHPKVNKNQSKLYSQ